jgi:hypothetical protein
MAEENKTLYYLKELSDYKVADDYQDVRGWDVKDATSRTIGKVDGLLVNKETERTVYLDVEVDNSLMTESRTKSVAAAGNGIYAFSSKDSDDHLIIPVELVTLDEVKKEVQASRIKYETFVKARRFPKGTAIDPAYESEMLTLYVEQNTLAKW